MSWLSQLFNPSGGYDKAMSANQKGYDESQAIRQPWEKQGMEAGGDLMQMAWVVLVPL